VKNTAFSRPGENLAGHIALKQFRLAFLRFDEMCQAAT
jgi:hypothetical protein